MPMSPYMRELRTRVGTMRLLVPSVTGVVHDDAGRILLVQQRDDERWSTPGGAIDPAETPADAVVREVWEETGLLVTPRRVLGVYGGPAFLVRYPNGDEAQYVSTIFSCVARSGTLIADGTETIAARYWTADEMRALPLASWLRPVMPVLFAAALDETWFEAPRWTPPVT
jgi:8-oxo-dGTP pyrophosphatase MutT (NUDIX family)